MIEYKTTNYYSNGKIRKYEWWLTADHLKLHKINGPASIEYYPNGEILGTVWYKNGLLHRTNGPAVIKYFNEVTPVAHNEYWFINGMLLTEEIFNWLKDNKIFSPYSDEDITAIILRWT